MAGAASTGAATGSPFQVSGFNFQVFERSHRWPFARNGPSRISQRIRFWPMRLSGIRNYWVAFASRLSLIGLMQHTPVQPLNNGGQNSIEFPEYTYNHC